MRILSKTEISIFLSRQVALFPEEFVFHDSHAIPQKISDDPDTYCGYCKKDLDVAVHKYILVEEDSEIIPNVEVICLPGHTPGLLGLVIHHEKSVTYIFPMDAVYTNEIYGPPAKASGLLHNREEYFKSIERVRALQKKYNTALIPAHDWDLWTLKKAPLFYD